MTTVSDIIRDAGGARGIAARVKLSESAVHKWRVNGIPDRYWPDLIDMAGDGLTPLDFFRANVAARNSTELGRAS